MDRDLHDFLKKEFEWQRHLLYQILINQEKQMSKEAELAQALSELTAAVNKALSQSATVTPDPVVSAAVASMQGLTSQLNAAFPDQPTP